MFAKAILLSVCKGLDRQVQGRPVDAVAGADARHRGGGFALSSLIGARTEFYLLNPVGAKPIIVTGKRGELEVLKAGLGQPWGRTPLAQTTERIVVG